MADGGVQEGAFLHDEVRVPMCKLHNLTIELYCQKHNKTVCSMCKLMEHRKCQLQTLEQAATDARSTGKNVRYLEQLREIKTQMEKIGSVLGDETEILESDQARVIEEIESKMNEIETLGRNKITEVEDIFKQERTRLGDETRALAQSKLLVDKSINELETATTYGSEEEIFVATKATENDVSTFHDIVNDSSHLSHAAVAFTVDSSLIDVHTLGDVSVERRDVTVDLTPDVIEFMAIPESDMNEPSASVDQSTPPNRFSVVNKPEEDSSRRYSGSSPARGDSKGRGGFDRHPSLNARPFQKSEREKIPSATKAIGGRPSQEAPRETSRGRDPGPESQPAAPAIKELSAEDMEKKTNSILDEFLLIQDLKEAILCVRELSVNNHHHFVYNAINHVIERSQVARRQTGHLLHDLVKDNVISSKAYLKGLLEVLEFAEDMEIDIPKIWQYYGELISPMIQDGSVQLSFLKPVCQPLLTSNKAGLVLTQVLRDASHREGRKKVAGLWASSGLEWTDFVPRHQVDKFLKDMDLEFMKGGDSAPTTPTTGLPVKDVADRLHLLIVVQGVDNENVFDWIDTNVDEPTTKQPKFLRALMTAVCNSAIKGEKGNERVQPKEINKRNDLLQKYLDHQSDFELQAMYALQAIVTKLKHPPGVLRHMFDTFYDEDIISEDAFIQWEKSEDEPDGKDAALKQVVQFFTWLREAEDDS